MGKSLRQEIEKEEEAGVGTTSLPRELPTSPRLAAPTNTTPKIRHIAAYATAPRPTHHGRQRRRAERPTRGRPRCRTRKVSPVGTSSPTSDRTDRFVTKETEGRGGRTRRGSRSPDRRAGTGTRSPRPRARTRAESQRRRTTEAGDFAGARERSAGPLRGPRARARAELQGGGDVREPIVRSARGNEHEVAMTSRPNPCRVPGEGRMTEASFPADARERRAGPPGSLRPGSRRAPRRCTAGGPAHEPPLDRGLTALASYGRPYGDQN